MGYMLRLVGLVLVVPLGLCRMAAGSDTEKTQPRINLNVGYRVLDLKDATAEKETTVTVAV